MKTLTDIDMMPFGQYKGKKMEEVPASYLHWLWFNCKKTDMNCPVADYIRRNRSSLEAEDSDLIWD